MVKLFDKGVYLLNGTEIAKSAEEAKAKTGQEVSQEEAARNTMALFSPRGVTRIPPPW